MKVAISGITGFVGTHLKAELERQGTHVIPVFRSDFKLSGQQLAQKLSGVDTVIHLAGAPIIKRWTKAYKKEIVDSRVDTTNLLVEAINQMETPPRLFISTSAIGIYQNNLEHTEDSKNLNPGFIGEVCRRWEQSALQVKPEVRTVIFRVGVVLGKDGGAMKPLLPLFRMGLGGKIGSGQQGFSWIHIEDLIKAYQFMIENEKVKGVFNLVAPHIITNADFTRVLGKVLQRPTLFPVPVFGLKMLYGQGAQTLTQGAYVKPERLLQEGFKFQFYELEAALMNVVR